METITSEQHQMMMRMLSMDGTVSEIAQELGISREEVNDLIKFAEQNGLIPTEKDVSVQYLALAQSWLVGRISHIQGAIQGGRPLEVGQMDLEIAEFLVGALKYVDMNALIKKMAEETDEVQNS